MDTPIASAHRAKDLLRIRRRPQRLLPWVKLVLFIEDILPRLWPSAAFAGAFISASWLGLFDYIAGGLHALLLLATFGAIIALLSLSIKNRRRFTQEDCWRRLEVDGALSHRPLQAMSDGLGLGDDDAVAKGLWRAHLIREAERSKAISLSWPEPRMGTRDPYMLRALLCLVLVVAFIGAQDQHLLRLEQALHPKLTLTTPAPPRAFEIWLTPPSYTGAAPIYANQSKIETNKTLNIPRASKLIVRLEHPKKDSPRLLLADKEYPLTKLSPGAYQFEVALENGDHIRLVDGKDELINWRLHFIDDTAPAASLSVQSPNAQDHSLQMTVGANDDYGVTRLALKISLQKPSAQSQPMFIELSTFARPLREVKLRQRQDLSANAWAGQGVDITLQAFDHLGQIGESPPVSLVLPERQFHHPGARVLAQARKQLFNGDSLLHVRQRVEEKLMTFLLTPEWYGSNVTAFLAVNSSMRRVQNLKANPELSSVRQLLWETALSLEEGASALARRDVEQISRQLAEALANGADQKEIERLMDELAKAMERLMRSLAESDAPLEAFPSFDTQNNGEFVDAQDLMEMLDQARQMAKTGAREAAAKMLSQLQNILGGLNASPRPNAKDIAKARQRLDQLRELRDAERGLLDQTFRTESRQRESGEGVQPDKAGALAQKGLMRSLEKFMDELSGQSSLDLPDLMAAKKSMANAQKSLDQGDLSRAVQDQSQAVDSLQRALQQAGSQLSQQLGLSAPPKPGQSGSQKDPFGRTSRGNLNQDGVQIPAQGGLNRAHDILLELQRRAGDLNRSERERDYIERLLERF